MVGNGWYSREDCEVKFWKQSNKLVGAPKIWEAAKAADPAFTCANVFWWFNMYSTVDYSVTPRPIYRADGLKLPDIYTSPAALRAELNAKLGEFPLFDFWGPRAGIASTKWIGESAKEIETRFGPTLTLIYLPHLDYNLQRLGPADPVDGEGPRRRRQPSPAISIAFYESRGAHVVVLSEYGLVDVSRPVHLNRLLRDEGFIAVREELGGELLDAGASAAFAVADHQVAHIYINDPAAHGRVRAILEAAPGVERVLDRSRTGGASPRPRARGRPRRDRRPGRLVHVLLLARRPSRARLRAHGRYPPQAGLRPGRARARSGHPAPAAQGRLDAGEEGRRVSLSDGRDSAGRDTRQGLARPSRPRERRRAACHWQ